MASLVSALSLVALFAGPKAAGGFAVEKLFKALSLKLDSFGDATYRETKALDALLA